MIYGRNILLNINKNKYQKLALSGFTLIELLVTFSLITIVSGVGFASFVSYSRRQTVVQTAANIKQAVDLARFNALSFVKPADCTDEQSLTSYSVNFCANALCSSSDVDYEVVANCSGNTVVVHTDTVPEQVSLGDISGTQDCTTITFGSLNSTPQGVPCGIRVSGLGEQADTHIDSNGHVSF